MRIGLPAVRQHRLDELEREAVVLRAGLTWRQATVLRAYAKYARQGGSPFALDYIEEALRSNVDITRLLVDLFESRFDPGRGDRALEADAEARSAKVEAIAMSARACSSSPCRTAFRNEPASSDSAFSAHMSEIGLEPQ